MGQVQSRIHQFYRRFRNTSSTFLTITIANPFARTDYLSSLSQTSDSSTDDDGLTIGKRDSVSTATEVQIATEDKVLAEADPQLHNSVASGSRRRAHTMPCERRFVPNSEVSKITPQQYSALFRYEHLLKQAAKMGSQLDLIHRSQAMLFDLEEVELPRTQSSHELFTASVNLIDACRMFPSICKTCRFEYVETLSATEFVDILVHLYQLHLGKPTCSWYCTQHEDCCPTVHPDPNLVESWRGLQHHYDASEEVYVIDNRTYEVLQHVPAPYKYSMVRLYYILELAIDTLMLVRVNRVWSDFGFGIAFEEMLLLTSMVKEKLEDVIYEMIGNRSDC